MTFAPYGTSVGNQSQTIMFQKGDMVIVRPPAKYDEA